MFLLPRRSLLLLSRRGDQHRRSAVRTLKEIRHSEQGEETVIEGVKVPSDRSGRLVDVERLRPELLASAAARRESDGGGDHVGACALPSRECHPLCRLPFVDDIKHTDVLILRQFMQEDGRVMDRSATGLCRRQHQRVNKLIKMAAKAGLFPPELDQYRHEKTEEPFRDWSSFNTYWDERTIDAQFREQRRKSYKRQFTEPDLTTR